MSYLRKEARERLDYAYKTNAFLSEQYGMRFLLNEKNEVVFNLDTLVESLPFESFMECKHPGCDCACGHKRSCPGCKGIVNPGVLGE